MFYKEDQQIGGLTERANLLNASKALKLWYKINVQDGMNQLN